MQKFIRRDSKGNTLALLAAITLLLVVTVAIVMMNYSQMIGGHKEVTNAVDAAAIQAAKDMSRIVVDGPLGRIALVDDGPGTNGYPVQSVNTVLGNLRLDAIVASRLGNTTLQWLVVQDLNNLNSTVNLLKQKLELARTGASGAYDKDGNAVIIGGNSGSAMTVYKSNNKRMLQVGNSNPAGFDVAFGTVATPVSSQVPVPNPTTGDSVTYNQTNSYGGTTKYYLSNTKYPVVSSVASAPDLQFLAVSSGQPALCDNANWKSSVPANIVPTVVQVTVQESAKAMAGGSSVAQKNLQQLATAMAGGNITSLLAPSGALVVSFAGPIPPDPPSSGSNPLKFDTVQHIINASQFTATDNSPTSSYNGWRSQDNQTSVGNWNTAEGGDVPGSGSFPQPAKPFKGMTGRASDDPSIALTFLVYDWLRSLGTRPNLNSVVSALTFDMRSYSGTAPKQFTASSTDPDKWLPAAYAQAAASAPETSGVFQLDASGEDDPRNLRFWNLHPEEYQRQQARMWGYVPGEGVMPADTKMVQIKPDGSVTTMDGNPASVLNHILDQINYSNLWANMTFAAVYNIVVEKANDLAKDDPQMKEITKETGGRLDPESQKKLDARFEKLVAKVLKENPRIEAVYANSQYVSQAARTMKANLKNLTGGGASMVNGWHYILMDSDFYPVTAPATKEQILGENPISTGQDMSLGSRANWALPVKADKSSNISFFEKAKGLAVPVSKADLHDWLPPAMAQSANPTNSDNKFIFNIYDKDAAALGNFRVSMMKSSTSPFANVPTLKKQAHYQNVNAIVLKATNDPTAKVSWQVQAKDQLANAYPSQANASTQVDQSTAASHFSSQKASSAYCGAGSGSQCPSLVSEWAMTCPLVKSPPPTSTPPSTPPASPPPATPPPPPPCTRVEMGLVGSNGIFANSGTYDSRGNYVHGVFTGQYATLVSGYSPWWGWYQYWDTKGYNTAIGGPYFVSAVYGYYYTCDPRPIYYAT